MRAFNIATSLVVFVAPAIAQQYQIWDSFTTTWDRSSSFTYKNLNPNPLNFGTPGPIGQADIVIDDTTGFQTMFGHGGALTDSSAFLMNSIKQGNPTGYHNLLTYLFDPTDTNYNAGMNYLRIPLGASDFSFTSYTYDDTYQDTSLSHFSVDAAPSYVFDVLKDIMAVNPYIKVHLLPWSPPGWMKDSGSINGGKFLNQYIQTYANYLLKALQGWQSKGVTAYAIGIQNEPQNSNPTYPTAIITSAQESQIASALRTLMNQNGFTNTKIIGYEHNWDDAGVYPVQLMQQASDAFDGAAFHCYAGSVSAQDQFTSKFPDKEVYFSECTGTFQGDDWWSDIKWYMDNLFIGSVEHGASSVLMWNIMLDGSGYPLLQSSNSCRGAAGGCRAMVTIDGTNWSVNQEFLTSAHTSKAFIPKDVDGPFGRRIKVSVGGNENWALRVGAYVTGRKNASDPLRYSIVVLNWNDNSSSTWNPQPVTTTIEFRGTQVTYTFPVGITTLWWYAPTTSTSVQ